MTANFFIDIFKNKVGEGVQVVFPGIMCRDLLWVCHGALRKGLHRTVSKTKGIKGSGYP
jgi:hypothetical protein